MIKVWNRLIKLVIIQCNLTNSINFTNSIITKSNLITYMYKTIAEYIRSCDTCQWQGVPVQYEELYSIQVE